MRIPIKYNDSFDEFTNDLILEQRLKNYINNHFSPAYTISILAPIYLVGGSIRDLIYARKPKDMDFVVLGKEHSDWVMEILNGYGINFTLNRFGGYKFDYEGTVIDLWIAEDIFSSMQYNVDGLYFNVNANTLLSLTFDDFRKNGIRLINEENNITNGRENKLIEFEKQYLHNSEKNPQSSNKQVSESDFEENYSLESLDAKINELQAEITKLKKQRRKILSKQKNSLS